MTHRTTGAIALRPTGNQQGGQHFMSLNTGKRIHRFAWSTLPMPADVIERVHVLARRSMAASTVLFERTDGEVFAPDLDNNLPDDADPDPFGPPLLDPTDDTTDDDDSTYAPGDDASYDDDMPALRPRTNHDDDSDSDSDDDDDDDMPSTMRHRAGVSVRRHPLPPRRRPVRRGLFSTSSDEDSEPEPLPNDVDGVSADPDNGVHDDGPKEDGGYDPDDGVHDDGPEDSYDPDDGVQADGPDDGAHDPDDGIPTDNDHSPAQEGVESPENETTQDVPELVDDPAPDDHPAGDLSASGSWNDREDRTVGGHSSSDRDDRTGERLLRSEQDQQDGGDKEATPSEDQDQDGHNPIDQVDDDPGFYVHPQDPNMAETDQARRKRIRLARLRRQLGDHNRRGRREQTVTFAPDEGYALRARKPASYGHVHAGIEDVLMTQYPVKKGLKVFGKRGAEAVVSEMKQLHDMDVLKPKAANMLSPDEKRKALPYLLFLTEKRSGKIKARGCADGRRQRVYKTKEETSSPTVALESVFLTSLIDAKERRKVVTVDVPGAFMQSDMDEVVHMRIDGDAAKLLLQVDQKRYEPFLTEEKGKPVLYVQLIKALYGTLQAAYLFWLDLSAELEKMGFVRNDYDLCVANKTINGKQCTIVWHVDDLKISHVEQAVLEEIVQRLQDRYGKLKPLTVNRGTKHDYLGMTLDFGEEGKVKIMMHDYVKKLVEVAPKSMDGIAATPAEEDLFVRGDEVSVRLNNVEKEAFHTIVAKLLFLAKRARPDTLTPVSYLTTRVTCPNQLDWKKLGRVIKYLRGTQELYLTLEAEDIRVVKWWVDGSYAVHGDMRSHTGGTMSLGAGSVYSTSTKQKLNTRSSTETELVAVDDVMPQILWTKYFLRSQGYKTDPSRIYQDNLSTMLLAKNGRRSSGRRTRHLDIRYFFVTDRIGAKDVLVQHCPTSTMLGDFFTKPLQGAQFKRLRDRILNWK